MAKKSVSDDIELFHDKDLYIPTRTIWIGSVHESDGDFTESGCDAHMAERAVKNLHILESLGIAPITIMSDNIGGDEYHCFAIYDAIRSCQSEVTIRVCGHAMSAGSIILQAADVRIMMPTSRQMIHYGTWGNHDHSKTYQKWAKEGEKIDKWMEQMYLEKIREKHPEFTLPRLQKLLNFDTILNAAESVELGLADKVE